MITIASITANPAKNNLSTEINGLHCSALDTPIWIIPLMDRNCLPIQVPVQEYLIVSFGVIFISSALGCSVGSVTVTNGISSSSISASVVKCKLATTFVITRK